MDTNVVEAAIDAVVAKYEIVPTIDGYIITRDGVTLRQGGLARVYTSRSSARKRIHRERTGNFHS